MDKRADQGREIERATAVDAGRFPTKRARLLGGEAHRGRGQEREPPLPEVGLGGLAVVLPFLTGSASFDLECCRAAARDGFCRMRVCGFAACAAGADAVWPARAGRPGGLLRG
jgi:hypothetical protein